MEGTSMKKHINKRFILLWFFIDLLLLLLVYFIILSKMDFLKTSLDLEDSFLLTFMLFFSTILIIILNFILSPFILRYYAQLEMKKYTHQLESKLNLITHQFKSPLTALSLYIDILKGTDLNDFQSSLLNKVDIQKDRCSTYVHNLLSYYTFYLQKDDLDMKMISTNEFFIGLIDEYNENKNRSVCFRNRSDEFYINTSWMKTFFIDLLDLLYEACPQNSFVLLYTYDEKQNTIIRLQNEYFINNPKAASSFTNTFFHQKDDPTSVHSLLYEIIYAHQGILHILPHTIIITLPHTISY